MSITGHSISRWLPCPVPSQVPTQLVAIQSHSVKVQHYVSNSICVSGPCSAAKPAGGVLTDPNSRGLRGRSEGYTWRRQAARAAAPPTSRPRPSSPTSSPTDSPR